MRAERSNYFDAGISQIVIPGLTVGVDAYYKKSQNLIDEGQFGAPIILTAFNYAKGCRKASRLTASYDRGPWSLYGNLAWSRAMGKDINSAQYQFQPAELAFIASNCIHLDHDQLWTSSGGTPTRSTGQPASDPGVGRCNLAKRAARQHADDPERRRVANLRRGQHVGGAKAGVRTELRVDVLNIGDTIYEIRNGTGVGVGAPQYGIRRTILAGITQRF